MANYFNYYLFKVRKTLHIGLVFLLLFSTMGVAVSKHYCGEILQKMAFDANDKQHCCENEGMPEDCCSNETDLIQTSEFQSAPLTLVPALSPYVLYTITFSLIGFQGDANQNVLIAHSDSPPLADQDIFVLVASFLL